MANTNSSENLKENVSGNSNNNDFKVIKIPNWLSISALGSLIAIIFFAGMNWRDFQIMKEDISKLNNKTEILNAKIDSSLNKLTKVETTTDYLKRENDRLLIKVDGSK